MDKGNAAMFGLIFGLLLMATAHAQDGRAAGSPLIKYQAGATYQAPNANPHVGNDAKR
jgi:uncharacterized protein YfiM (DUF2279 family)